MSKAKADQDNKLPRQTEGLLSTTRGERILNGTDDKIQNLRHELEVHKVELELQKEELRKAQAAIEESRSKYSELYDFAPIGYITFDNKVVILEVNLTGAKLFGVERRSLLGKPFLPFIPPDFQDFFHEHLRAVLSTDTKQTCELQLMKKDGNPFYVYLESLRVKDKEGHLSLCRSAISDITSRKLAEQTANSEYAFRRSIENSIIAGIVAVDLKGRLTYVNPAFCNMIGRTKEELIGSMPPYLFWLPEEAKKITADFLAVITSQNQTGSFEHTLQRQNGELFDVLTLFSPLKGSQGEVVGWIASVSDITERKRAEAALKASEERLKHLSSKLLAAHEEERKRIAHELHDSLGQYLTTIKLKTESILQKTHKTGEKRITEPLESLVSIIQGTIEETRRIQMALRPTILDDLGILAGLNWLSREFQDVYSHIHIEPQIDLQEKDIPDSLKTTIFRISQEALHNIARHSKADLVCFSFRKTMSSLELTIKDNGQGFAIEEALSVDVLQRGSGLTIMRERAELSGGTFDVQSARGMGTVIRTRWPA